MDARPDRTQENYFPHCCTTPQSVQTALSYRYARAAARYIKQSSKAPTNHPSPVSLVQVTSDSESTPATSQSSQTPTSQPTPDAAVQGTLNSHTAATSLETSTPPVADDEGTEFDPEIHKFTDEIVSLKVKVEELENELGRLTKLNNDFTSKLKHYGPSAVLWSICVHLLCPLNEVENMFAALDQCQVNASIVQIGSVSDNLHLNKLLNVIIWCFNYFLNVHDT